MAASLAPKVMGIEIWLALILIHSLAAGGTAIGIGTIRRVRARRSPSTIGAPFPSPLAQVDSTPPPVSHTGRPGVVPSANPAMPASSDTSVNADDVKAASAAALIFVVAALAFKAFLAFVGLTSRRYRRTS